MIALDTNIILRLLVQDDLGQMQTVLDYLEANHDDANPPYISDLVLAEAVWALKSRYGLRRNEIAGSLDKLLANSLFVFESGDRLSALVYAYASSALDLADLLIAENASRAGCTRILSFDKVAIKAGIMHPIEAEGT